MSNVNFIQQDIATVTTYQQLSAASISAVFTVAQNTLNLANQIYQSSQFSTCYNHISAVIDGICNYYTATNTITAVGIPTYFTDVDGGFHFGDKNSYFGNLGDITIYNTPYGDKIYTHDQLQSLTFVLSAPRGQTWSDGSTLSASTSATFNYFNQEFQFLCQYLWATPTQNLWVNPDRSVASSYNPKLGLYYSAHTLMQSVCTLFADANFLTQKKMYLSDLV